LSIINQFHPAEGLAIYQMGSMVDNLTKIGWYSLGFVVLASLIYFLRHLITKNRKDSSDTTWGCGYTGDASKMQYTASSYVRTYRKLVEPVLSIKKEKTEAIGLYPVKVEQETHPGDKIENVLIYKPVLLLRKLLNSFAFLQNGKIQVYLLYGIIFIALAILLPIIIEKTAAFINFLNQL
jgi:hypothetical protein